MKKLLLALIVFLQLSPNAFSRPVRDVEDDYLNSIKITFLSWISGSTKLSYERAFPSWKQSGEICASLISAGYDKYHNHPMGFTLRYGHKFFIKGKDTKSLMGFYLRPEITLVNSALPVFCHAHLLLFQQRKQLSQTDWESC